MRADNFDEAYTGGGLAGLMSHDGELEDGYDGEAEDPDGDEAGMAGVLAPLSRPQTGLVGDIRRLGGALRTRHDWQPPTIREQRQAADPGDPHQRWAGGPATALLVTALLVLHDKGHSRAAAAVAGAALAVLILIAALLLTHGGA